MKAHTGSNQRKRASRPPISTRRRWGFRIFALLLLPLLLLGALELGLRLAGYGYATGFFRQATFNHQLFLIDNEEFTRRFFPEQLMRWPGPVMFPALKPAHTFRIFVLGESAARGEPEPAWAASRYLEALLDERFPNTHFEVINLGITAINSHVILPLARDCARADADLWIIYMGNNEMVGPFGAATVFGPQAPPLALVRLNLALQQCRLGQCLMDLGRRAKTDPNASWGGMKMFMGNQLRADDPRRERVYRNFERNLDDLLQVGLGSGAKILLNTVAVNLKDCPPFASLTNASLSAADSARFQALFSGGCQAADHADFARAAQTFAEAAKLDPQYAALQFRWAECLAQTGQPALARDHYQQACDDDALPFRTDSRLNGLIAAAGKKWAGDKLAFLDAAATLAGQGTNGICGRETFFEHVHFNFDGNFRLGRAWAAQMEHLLPAEIWRSAVSNDWASQELCERRLALTDGNRCAVAQTMLDRLQRPPFAGQLNHAEQVAQLREESAALSRRLSPAPARLAAVEMYQQAIQQTPGDFLLYQNFAEFLESERQLEAAVAQWRHVSESLPFHGEAFYEMGRLLNQMGKWSEAQAALTTALRLHPRLAEAWYELGNANFGGSQFETAFENYARAARLDPERAVYRALAGRALARLGRHADAIAWYRQTAQIDPDFAQLSVAIGDELAAAGQIADAREAYAQAVRSHPEDALAHLDLGVMLARLGKMDEAASQFRETLDLQPGNQTAQAYLQRVGGQAP